MVPFVCRFLAEFWRRDSLGVDELGNLIYEAGESAGHSAVETNFWVAGNHRAGDDYDYDHNC
jgi:hypothetical protein